MISTPCFAHLFELIVALSEVYKCAKQMVIAVWDVASSQEKICAVIEDLHKELLKLTDTQRSLVNRPVLLQGLPCRWVRCPSVQLLPLLWWLLQAPTGSWFNNVSRWASRSNKNPPEDVGKAEKSSQSAGGSQQVDPVAL